MLKVRYNRYTPARGARREIAYLTGYSVIYDIPKHFEN
jgi:hypothetical protein